MKQSFFSVFVVMTVCGLFSACSPVVSCSNAAQEATETISVMNWNLQTFFDATFDGNEYSEFKNGNAGWTREKYDTRLDRLAAVIKTLDADVLVFEELEKEAQLYDISNRLSGTFNFSKLYSYACFATDKASSIGCGVLSRYPLGELAVHALDVRTAESEQPSMRPILQVSVFSGEKKLVLFVNHWKSKTGNGDTAQWRQRQEALLSRVMGGSLASGVPVLACGDFNMDILEFSPFADSTTEYGKNGIRYTANVLLNSADAQEEKRLPVYSPWYDVQGNLIEPGSYWFDSAWERIDDFFAAGNVLLASFAPRTDGSWATSAGKPVRYQVHNGSGYSDHLPITCTVRF